MVYTFFNLLKQNMEFVRTKFNQNLFLIILLKMFIFRSSKSRKIDRVSNEFKTILFNFNIIYTTRPDIDNSTQNYYHFLQN